MTNSVNNLQPSEYADPSPQILEFSVTEETQGMRLDRFLSQQIEKSVGSISRNALESYFDKGLVTVDRHRAKKSLAVMPGQCVRISQFVLPSELKLKPNLQLPVSAALTTDDFVVLVKPAGIPSHAIRIDDKNTLSNYVLARYPETRGVGEDPLRPGIAHRLDTDTSGLIVVARHQAAYDIFRGLFTQRLMNKEYRALVLGSFPYISKTFTVPIAHHPRSMKRMIAVPNAHEVERLKARDAITHVERLEATNDYSYLKVSIETGRMHQIRVHLAHAGFPVSGDAIYRKGGDRAKDWLNPSRHLLHAMKLAFTYEGKNYEVETKLPPDFADALQKCKV